MLGHRRAPTREFLYVDDAAEGIVLAPSATTGPSRSTSAPAARSRIRDLVETIADAAGFEGEIRWDPSKPDGQPRRCLDVSRAEQEFGFRARTPFTDGLRATIEWYETAGKGGLA